MRFSIFFILFFISNAVFSQKISSLTNKEYLELQEKAKALMSSNIDSSFIVTERIEKSNNYAHKAFAAGAKSYLFQIKGDTAKSNQFYRIAFENLKKVPPSIEKNRLNAGLLNFGGLTAWKRKKFSKALDQYQAGKKLSESIGDLIQVVKFNNNIALIYAEVGNFKLAIKTSKETDKFTDQKQFLYTKEQFIRSKNNVNFNLGKFYEEYYNSNKANKYLLDSAEYYYKKSLNYSKNSLYNKINAKINLGDIYYQKNELLKAKELYQEVLFTAKEDPNLEKEYYFTMYNLGDLCFTLKKYEESLMYFQKVDSIFKVNKTNKQQFINSNYYQAKIYNLYKNADKATAHSKIYIDNNEISESELNEETAKVNLKLNNADVKKEMISIQNKYKYQALTRNCFIGFLGFLLVLGYIVKSKRDKKKIEEKVNAIIDGFKSNPKNEAIKPFDIRESAGIHDDKINSQNKKEAVSITIDEEKEEEILYKLTALEAKLYYLHPDFTQQSVAKKIKTNTTYLSYVVNKRFGKSFSEYSNELKINYAINEMITNPMYRKYSTQAIAESVGFKNAVSFAKSFNKRTGVTPVQFVKRLENKEL